MSTTPSRDQELKRGSPLWLFSSTNAWRAAAQQAFANFSGWHSAARVGVLQAFINGSKRLLIFGFQVFVRSEVRTLQLKLAPGFSHAQSILPQSTGAFSIGRSAHGFATCCWPPAGTCAASRYGSSGITIHAMI